MAGTRSVLRRADFPWGEHTYYREAVEDLYLTMKPCRYELDLRATQEDAAELRAYLAKHLRPGETVELWNLWVGDGPARPRRLSGTLGDVELDTLKQLEETGAQEAWLKIQAIDPSACIQRLQGLEGAVRGIPKKELPEEVKAELKEFYRQHKL